MSQHKPQKNVLPKRIYGRLDSQSDGDFLSNPDINTKEDSVLELQSIQEQEELVQLDLNFKRRVHEIDPNELLKTFQDQGLHISTLSVGQYGSLLKHHSNQLIPAVPELPQLSGAFRARDMPFLTFRQVQEFSLAACTKVQESFFESRNRWKTYHKKLFSIGGIDNINTKSTRAIILSPSSTNLSKYQSFQTRNSDTDANLQLKHNKEQIKQIIKLGLLRQEEAYNQNIKDITKHIILIKEQKIKVYPSKIIEQQKRKVLSKMQAQLEDSFNQGKKQTLPQVQKQEILIENKVKPFDLFFYEIEQFHVKPEMRESAAIVAHKDKIYLYGGIGMQTFNSFWVMDQATLNWSQINQVNNIYNTPARNAHTMLFYKKNLVIFGGETQSTSEKGRREFLSDVKIFNIATSSWQMTVPQQSYIITARRNHSAVVVGRFMIIFGGIDLKSRYLNDVWIFDLTTFKWALGEVEKNTDIHPQGVAFHQACAIYHPLKKYNSLYRQEELKTSDKVDKRSSYQQEGMFVFGGLSIKDELIENSIFLLKSDVRPMTWVVLETKGQAPMSRFGHSMNFNERLGLVVVYGGRNHSIFLSDTHILRCDNLCWQQVAVHNDSQINRAFHCTTQVETKLFIFGGYAEHGFVSSDVLVLEMDSSIAKTKARMIQISKQAKSPRAAIQVLPKQIKPFLQEQKDFDKRKMIHDLAFIKTKNLSPLQTIPSVKSTSEAALSAKKLYKKLQIRLKSDTEHFVQHELNELTKVSVSKKDEDEFTFKGRKILKNTSILKHKQTISIHEDISP